MKKLFLSLFSTVILCSSATWVAAQSVGYSRPQQAAFVELGGNGLIVSFNYDTRLQNRPDGWGLRVGAGGLAAGNDFTFVSVPVQVNYLAGRNGNYFEVGAGITYSNGRFWGIDDSRLFGTTTFGYRHQPVNGGFLFRAGLTPIFTVNDNDGPFFIPYFAGISLGYAFPSK